MHASHINCAIMPRNAHTAVHLRLSRRQAEWIFWELTGQLECYIEEGTLTDLEPEEEVSIRAVLRSLEKGIKRAEHDAQYELDELRKLTINHDAKPD